MVRAACILVIAMAFASMNTYSAPVLVDFSGHEWIVKSSPRPAAPGPNVFSADIRTVWVDNQNRLHLTIGKRDGYWQCSEVICRSFLGYGTYTFRTEGRIDLLDKNIVFAMFTWDARGAEDNYREIDIEYSKWGQETANNGQFVLQPHANPSRVSRFSLDMDGLYATHVIHWYPDFVAFECFLGHNADNSPQLIADWSYRGNDIPNPGKARIRINFWLYNGQIPGDGTDAEMVITDFRHRSAGSFRLQFHESPE